MNALSTIHHHHHHHQQLRRHHATSPTITTPGARGRGRTRGRDRLRRRHRRRRRHHRARRTRCGALRRPSTARRQPQLLQLGGIHRRRRPRGVRGRVRRGRHDGHLFVERGGRGQGPGRELRLQLDDPDRLRRQHPHRSGPRPRARPRPDPEHGESRPEPARPVLRPGQRLQPAVPVFDDRAGLRLQRVRNGPHQLGGDLRRERVLRAVVTARRSARDHRCCPRVPGVRLERDRPRRPRGGAGPAARRPRSACRASTR